MLDVFQEHTKIQRNEVLRRRELFVSRQIEGEPFTDFFVRLKRTSEEVDICKGNHKECEETQLKQVILMGIRDEEFV